MSDFITTAASTATQNTTSTATQTSTVTPESVKGWLGLSGDVLGLGKSVWELITGKSYTDQEKALAMQGELLTYQQKQQRTQQTIIIIAAITVVVAILGTLYLTKHK